MLGWVRKDVVSKNGHAPASHLLFPILAELYTLKSFGLDFINLSISVFVFQLWKKRRKLLAGLISTPFLGIAIYQITQFHFRYAGSYVIKDPEYLNLEFAYFMLFAIAVIISNTTTNFIIKKVT